MERNTDQNAQNASKNPPPHKKKRKKKLILLHINKEVCEERLNSAIVLQP